MQVTCPGSPGLPSGGRREGRATAPNLRTSSDLLDTLKYHCLTVTPLKPLHPGLTLSDCEALAGGRRGAAGSRLPLSREGAGPRRIDRRPPIQSSSLAAACSQLTRLHTAFAGETWQPSLGETLVVSNCAEKKSLGQPKSVENRLVWDNSPPPQVVPEVPAGGPPGPRPRQADVRRPRRRLEGPLTI